MHWIPSTKTGLFELPKPIKDCLVDPRSTTLRFKNLPGQRQIKLLGEHYQAIGSKHNSRLKTRSSLIAFNRRVLIESNNTPWMYCHTLLPITYANGTRRRLLNLGNRSLGSVIFRDRTLRRSAFELTVALPGRADYEEATRHVKKKPEKLYGRRSLFYLSGKPFLLVEYFFPECIQALLEGSQ